MVPTTSTSVLKRPPETVPGKGWFTILRIYGPLEPWFSKTWQPGDIALLE